MALTAPPPLLKNYVRHCRSQIEAQRRTLAMMEAGDLKMQVRQGGGPLIDHTESQKLDLRRTIAELEEVMAMYDRDYGLDTLDGD